MPHVGTATLAELSYTLIALVGIVVSVLNTYDSHRIVRRVRAARMNGYRLLLAGMDRRTDARRLVVCSLLFIFGLDACLTPPNPHAKTSQLGDVLAVVLIIVLTLTILDTYRDRRERHKIRVLMEAEDRAWFKEHKEAP
jgi:hypothetical protein